MSWFIEVVLHLDEHLLNFVQTYGTWVYGLLAGIVFLETGVVVTPFLPGDSLLFATGAICALGALNPWIAIPLLIGAAIAGDAVNYTIGRRIGPKIFSATDNSSLFHRLLNRDHLNRAHEFFERYGGKAIVLGRFVPIVRTFVPFVAGAAQMSRTTFVFYNITGAVAWVVLCLGAGILWGNVPFVKDNFSLVTIGIVFVSVLPMAIEMLRHRKKSRTLNEPR
jgi:membrane-associated protein